MKFSQKFGKRVSDNRIQHAPLVEGKTDEEYLSEGWKRLDLSCPEKEEGYFLKFGPFKEDEDGTIRQSYTKVKLSEQTKTYSKLKVMLALTKLGIWRGVREWLD